MNLLARPTGPGRPKDLEKRAAILEAAKDLFTERGYAGVSMDAIAQAAGVSKLTVYNHFEDKQQLFLAAVKAKCEAQMPHEMFDVPADGPLREQLHAIAHAFVALMSSPEALALQRTLITEGRADPALPALFYEAGPRRTLEEFAVFLNVHVRAGHLEIPDVPRAAGHFFGLLKGELQMRLLFGCGAPPDCAECEAHVDSVVDLFLRAYAPGHEA
jgi:TetR/AcrR family transcriptional regulator, mexJK operon transcriptional repressor